MRRLHRRIPPRIAPGPLRPLDGVPVRGVQFVIARACAVCPVDLELDMFAVGDGSQQPLGVTAVFGDGTSSPLALQPAGTATPAPAPTLSTWAILLLGTALAMIAAIRMRRAQRVRS